MSTLILFIPEIYLFISIFILLTFCILYYLSSSLNYPNVYNASVYLALNLLLYTFLLFVNNIVDYSDISMLSKNNGSILLSQFLILVCFIILVITVPYNKFNNIVSFEYIIFILFSVGSLLVFLNVMNFILIYILLELQNILLSVLISIKKYNRYSVEASIKYFILGSFSSLVLLFGVSILYGATGLISLNDLSLFVEHIYIVDSTATLIAVEVGSVFIFIGLLFKVYSAPFHFWLPDIYEGSPTSVVIYIATIPLTVMIFFFIKVYFFILFDLLKLKQLLLYTTSLITLLFGSIGALSQVKIKKIISLSTVTMSGFFLYSIVDSNIFLLETSLVYFFVYLVSILLLFILLLNIFVGNTFLNTLHDLFNIYSNNKILSNMFTVLVFSISGIPPFIGFISKLFWMKSLIIEYNILVFFLLLIFLIVSYYYIRFLKNVYYMFKNSDNSFIYVKTITYEVAITLFFLQFILLYLIIDSVFIRSFVKVILLSIVNAI